MTQAAGQQTSIFRGAIAKAERKRTAVLSVDASRCATTAGYFEIVFSRLKEIGIEIEFREQFMWRPHSVEVSVDFWADEAVEEYWLNTLPRVRAEVEVRYELAD